MPQSGTHSDNALIKQREELLTQQDFLATLSTERPAVIITSDAALAELAAASHSAVVVVTSPGSEVIARIGAENCWPAKRFQWKRWMQTICAGQTLKFSSKETAEMHRQVRRPRPAEPADLARLVEIASHSATAAQWNQAEYLKLFRHRRARSPTPSRSPDRCPNVKTQSRTALVVEQEGSVVGFIVGRQVEDEWEIENIAVTGAARRCGLGSRLVGRAA